MSQRILAIDQLRGLLIVSMVFDHSLIFLAGVSFLEIWSNPITPYTTYASALPRVFSHLVAPGFFLLLGIGVAFLIANRSNRGWSNRKIKALLFRRGVLLILLQFLLINLTWSASNSESLFTALYQYYTALLHLQLPSYYIGVFVSLGFSLSIAALCIDYKNRTLFVAAILSFLISAGSIYFISSTPNTWPILLGLLAIPGAAEPFYVLYPVFPWLGFTFIGIICGRWLLKNPIIACKNFITFGLLLCLAGVSLRTLGVGNFPYNEYSDLLTYLTLTKYPPSIVFILLTLGLNLLLLTFFVKLKSSYWISRILATFGTVPLFVYIAHLYLLLAAAHLFSNTNSLSDSVLIWILTLLLLYPLCRYRVKPKTT